MMQFHFEHAQFDYEPYPICYIPDFLDAGLYRELQRSYPSLEMFKYKKMLGDKYSLAEKNNADFYFDFIRKNRAWREFYHTVKSKKFVEDVFAFLRQHHIDCGVRRFIYTKDMKKKRKGPVWRIANKCMIRSRFEFSIMQANGGHILPHTDLPRKMVTLVLSFIDQQEWKQEWGGGTDVVLPKDRTRIYNKMNAQMPFSEVERIKTFPFNENQAVLFIKTYNSWHSVTPMTGPETGLRKTVTINIEEII